MKLALADLNVTVNVRAGHFTDVALSVANPQQVRTVATKLAAERPDSRPILRDEVLRTFARIAQQGVRGVDGFGR